jgi:hypothetical protein
MHLVHDPVEWRELELSLGRLEVIPRQITHADHFEGRLQHQLNVAGNVYTYAVHRLVAGSDEQLAGTRLAGMRVGILRRSRYGTEGSERQQESAGCASQLAVQTSRDTPGSRRSGDHHGENVAVRSLPVPLGRLRASERVAHLGSVSRPPGVVRVQESTPRF